MSGERQAVEKKSLRLVTGRNPDFDEIACECVGFANARGGHPGIEDREEISLDGKSINKKPQIIVFSCIRFVHRADADPYPPGEERLNYKRFSPKTSHRCQ